MFREPLFAHEHIQNLKHYKYASVDKSPTSKYFLRHNHSGVILGVSVDSRIKSVGNMLANNATVWDYSATLFPLWVAPNLITLLGLGCILVNLGLQVYFDPLLEGTAPSWVYYGHAVGLFLYQTLDNVDGRQARRTGSSSALGHCFDHTIDSLNCVLSGILQVAAIGAGNSWRGVAILITGSWAMWFSTWEEYHTHILYLGYLNGPTEGILIAVFMHFIAGYWGPSIWKTRFDLPADNPLSRAIGQQTIGADDLFVAFVILAAVIIHTPACLINVKRAYNSRDGFFGACTQNLWFMTYNALILGWLFAPSSSILRDGRLLEFALLQTFTFAKLGPRIILSYLTKARFPGYNDGAFLPLIVGVAALYLLPQLGLGSEDVNFTEQVILHLGLYFSSTEFLWWWTTLCNRFCEELDIYCLSLKHLARSKAQ